MAAKTTEYSLPNAPTQPRESYSYLPCCILRLRLHLHLPTSPFSLYTLHTRHGNISVCRVGTWTVQCFAEQRERGKRNLHLEHCYPEFPCTVYYILHEGNEGFFPLFFFLHYFLNGMSSFFACKYLLFSTVLIHILR